MVWALAFITVRQKQDHTRVLVPLLLCRRDELIDDCLGAVGEVAELGLPENQCVLVLNRVILCSGKVYWDLLAEAEKRNDRTTAIVRVEQLYPTPVDEIKAAYAQYPNAELVWVQDEPANQGPWTYIGLFLPRYMNGQVAKLVSRPASASPAPGSAKRHAVEQADLVARAFSI